MCSVRCYVRLGLFTFCLTAFSAFAADTPAERAAAADRYLKAVPLSQMLDGALAELAQQVPAEKRESFLQTIHSRVRIRRLEEILRSAMQETFTAAELNALADFYGSPHGAAAMRKLGTYMNRVIPALNDELEQAITAPASNTTP